MASVGGRPSKTTHLCWGKGVTRFQGTSAAAKFNGIVQCRHQCTPDLEHMHVTRPSMQWVADCVLHGQFPVSRELKMAFQLMPLPVSRGGLSVSGVCWHGE